jgi:hypothetical protein
MLKQLAILGFSLAAITGATASSDDAWAEFAAEVEQACIAASGDYVTNATALVDPFGSESYGLAIVTGDTVADTKASIICVFDKQTKAVEIGGELEAIVTPASE